MSQTHDIDNLCWLAGLLEGEGTFLKAPPSSPRSPAVRVNMTDHDLVERVASLWSVKCHYLAPRKPQHSCSYSTAVKGKTAVSWMLALRPLMGTRRREQIDAAIATWATRPRLVDFETVERMRGLRAEGVPYDVIGEKFGVNGEYVRGVCRRIFRVADHGLATASLTVPAGHFWMLPTPQKLHWLAGYLDGEGWFGGNATVSATTKDVDIAERVAALTGGDIYDDGPPRKAHWSPTKTVAINGLKGHNLMSALRPLMSGRRGATIDAVLDASLDRIVHSSYKGAVPMVRSRDA